MLRGTFFESSTEVMTVTIKGSGTTFANCKFDGPLPKGLKKGKPLTLKGIVSGYFMQVNVDHCAVVETPK